MCVISRIIYIETHQTTSRDLVGFMRFEDKKKPNMINITGHLSWSLPSSRRETGVYIGIVIMLYTLS